MTSDGFERAARLHGNRIHGHAVWMLGDREAARDVAQEALMRLWQHREDVPESAARGWLLKTAHRLCIDHSRRRAARRELPEDPVDLQPVDAAPDPERRAASSVLASRLESALRGLSPRNRAIVLLREVEGLNYEEIAETLAIPLGTLKAALHRSRERLREDLVDAGVRP